VNNVEQFRNKWGDSILYDNLILIHEKTGISLEDGCALYTYTICILYSRIHPLSLKPRAPLSLQNKITETNDARRRENLLSPITNRHVAPNLTQRLRVLSTMTLLLGAGCTLLSSSCPLRLPIYVVIYHT